jgi:hypothetical protein
LIDSMFAVSLQNSGVFPLPIAWFFTMYFLQRMYRLPHSRKMYTIHVESILLNLSSSTWLQACRLPPGQLIITSVLRADSKKNTYLASRNHFIIKFLSQLLYFLKNYWKSNP